MTDRHAGYVITLREDVREDDAEALVNAIKMIKGVVSVTPMTNDIPFQMAQERVRQQLGEELTTAIHEIWYGPSRASS